MCKAKATSLYSASVATLCTVAIAAGTLIDWCTVSLSVSKTSRFKDVISYWTLRGVDVVVPAFHIETSFPFSALSSASNQPSGMDTIVKYSILVYDIGIVAATLSAVAALLAMVSWFYPDYSGKSYYRLSGILSLLASGSLATGTALYYFHFAENANDVVRRIGKMSCAAADYVDDHTQFLVSGGIGLFSYAALLLLTVSFANFFVRLPVYSLYNVRDDAVTPMTQGSFPWSNSRGVV